MHGENKACPICGQQSDKFLIDKANLDFLSHLSNERKIDAGISIARIVWENIPHSSESRIIVDELSKTLLNHTQEQLNRVLEPMRVFIETFPKLIEKLPEDLRKDIEGEFSETQIKFENEFKTLSNNVRETLKEMGFPEPEQLKLLAQLIPSVLPLLDELLRSRRVPAEKGKQGELELIEQLREFYPEDECESIGGPGDTDILAIPRFNGANLRYKILIESKKNGSGWNRSFIQQTRSHMRLRGERFAILAVDTMPKGANGFLFEQCGEGVILVTDREYFRVSYGAVRSALIALYPFHHREIDFRRLFTDQKICEAVKEAYNYCEWVKKIKEKARRIETNAEGITEDVNELDKHLKQTLNELQTRINDAITQITTNENDELSLNHKQPVEVSVNDK